MTLLKLIIYQSFNCFIPKVAYRLNNANGLMSNAGWFAGFIGCFKPMWMMIGKGKQQEIEKGITWQSHK